MDRIELRPEEVRPSLESEYSDTYKQLAGFRPRRDLSALTDEDLYVEIQALCQEIDAEIAREEREARIDNARAAELAHRHESGEFRAPTSGNGWQLIPA